MGGVARQPVLTARRVEPQASGGRLVVEALTEQLELQRHGVHDRKPWPEAMDALAGVTQEAHLDGGMVGQQYPSVGSGEERIQCLARTQRGGQRVISDAVDGGTVAHIAVRTHQEVAGSRQIDLQPVDRHETDTQDLIATRVQPGGLQISGQ